MSKSNKVKRENTIKREDKLKAKIEMDKIEVEDNQDKDTFKYKMKSIKDEWFGVETSIFEAIIRLIGLAIIAYFGFYLFAGIILFGFLLIFCTPVFFVLLIVWIGAACRN